MSEDELLEIWTMLPAARARYLGFRIEPCDCGGTFPGCPGYQLAWERPAWLAGAPRQEPERMEAVS